MDVKNKRGKNTEKIFVKIGAELEKDTWSPAWGVSYMYVFLMLLDCAIKYYYNCYVAVGSITMLCLPL